MKVNVIIPAVNFCCEIVLETSETVRVKLPGDEVVVNFDLENCVERRLFGAHAAPKLRHFDARRMLEEIAKDGN